MNHYIYRISQTADLEVSLFPSIFCTIAVFSLNGEYVVRSFLLDGVYLPCDHGLDIYISLCENSINQSTINIWCPWANYNLPNASPASLRVSTGVVRTQTRPLRGIRQYVSVIDGRVVKPLGGGDATIPSTGRSPKQPLPRIGLNYTRQACPEFHLFRRGVGQVCTPKELFSCRPLPKRGHICNIMSPPNR